MQRLFQAILIASSLVLPGLVAVSSPVLADTPSSSAAPLVLGPRVENSTQPVTLSISSATFGAQLAAASAGTSDIARLTMPDLQTRLLDQTGAHDPTVTPPPGPQEVVVLGQTADLTLQVRNAGAGTADNVDVDLYLTGLLDPKLVLNAGDGFTCALNVPDAHFIRCTGGTLAAGGWNAAANITVRVQAVNAGSAVLAATANPGKTVAESNDDNDQDAQWVTVVPAVIR